MEYFQAHAREDISHGPVVDWVEEQYLALKGRKPRDTWRRVRDLYERGMLVQVKEGVYKYDPDYVEPRPLLDFTQDVKAEIFQRDDYRCVICGRGRDDGAELCADHRIPRSKGGTNTVYNGQTLCGQHNNLKKNYGQTEVGKRFFIKVYEVAAAEGNSSMLAFCRDVFDVYERHGMDPQVGRPDR
jgi:hypothetical protein